MNQNPKPSPCATSISGWRIHGANVISATHPTENVWAARAHLQRVFLALEQPEIQKHLPISLTTLEPGRGAPTPHALQYTR